MELTFSISIDHNTYFTIVAAVVPGIQLFTYCIQFPVASIKTLKSYTSCVDPFSVVQLRAVYVFGLTAVKGKHDDVGFPKVQSSELTIS